MIPILLFFGLCFFGLGDCDNDFEERMQELDDIEYQIQQNTASIFGYESEHRISDDCWHKYESGDWGFKDLYFDLYDGCPKNSTMTLYVKYVKSNETLTDEEMKQWFPSLYEASQSTADGSRK